MECEEIWNNVSQEADEEAVLERELGQCLVNMGFFLCYFLL